MGFLARKNKGDLLTIIAVAEATQDHSFLANVIKMYLARPNLGPTYHDWEDGRRGGER